MGRRTGGLSGSGRGAILRTLRSIEDKFSRGVGRLMDRVYGLRRGVYSAPAGEAAGSGGDAA